jgi:hypothetical protein
VSREEIDVCPGKKAAPEQPDGIPVFAPTHQIRVPTRSDARIRIAFGNHNYTKPFRGQAGNDLFYRKVLSIRIVFVGTRRSENGDRLSWTVRFHGGVSH